MAHGQRAALLSNNRREYVSKRPYAWCGVGSDIKRMTCRKERRSIYKRDLERRIADAQT